MSHPARMLGAVVLALCSFVAGAQERYDLVLRNGLIVDGSGGAPYRGDVAIRGDQIARIAPAITAPATQTIDVAGQVIAPGFIDVHVHATRGPAEGLFGVPTADNYIRQGVTTIIDGPDGGSPVPLAPFLAKLDALPKSINIGTFIGQGAVREAVVGLENRTATAEELETMRGLVAQGMTDGAFGLSSGLFYVPGIFTPTEEVVDLARVAARGGGIYISHMRDETSRVTASVEETILIGERGGLPTQVTHHKASGRPNWGKSVETLRLIDEARKRGVDATLDVYPYTASSTGLAAGLLPPWVLEGGRARMLERVKDPATRARARAEAVRIITEERGGGDPKNVVVSRCDAIPAAVGKNLAELTRGRGQEATIGNAADTLLWILEQDDCRGVFHAMDDRDVDRIIRHPAAMIASDGEVPVFGKDAPHPRSYGTFARVLAEYVRNRRVITLEQAVRKMAALPALRLKLADRGLLEAGRKADLAIFNPATVRDAATYENPHQYAVGFSRVIVNGVVVFEDGRMTAARPGKACLAVAKARQRDPDEWRAPNSSVESRDWICFRVEEPGRSPRSGVTPPETSTGATHETHLLSRAAHGSDVERLQPGDTRAADRQRRRRSPWRQRPNPGSQDHRHRGRGNPGQPGAGRHTGRDRADVRGVRLQARDRRGRRPRPHGTHAHAELPVLRRPDAAEARAGR